MSRIKDRLELALIKAVFKVDEPLSELILQDPKMYSFDKLSSPNSNHKKPPNSNHKKPPNSNHKKPPNSNHKKPPLHPNERRKRVRVIDPNRSSLPVSRSLSPSRQLYSSDSQYIPSPINNHFYPAHCLFLPSMVGSPVFSDHELQANGDDEESQSHPFLPVSLENIFVRDRNEEEWSEQGGLI